MMRAEANVGTAPAIGHHGAFPHPLTSSSRSAGSGPLSLEHSDRPVKRARPNFLDGHDQEESAADPNEQYVLLSGVKRWWEDMRGVVQKTEDSIEARRKHMKEVEVQLVARARALELREAAVTRQEAALAALMPRLQAVARMESAMAALIPHLKVISPTAGAAAPMPGSQIVYTQKKANVDLAL